MAQQCRVKTLVNAGYLERTIPLTSVTGCSLFLQRNDTYRIAK